MSDVKQETKREVHDAAEKAKAKAQDVAQEARAMAHDAAETAKNTAKAKVDQAKHAASGEVNNIASALRRAADESREGSPQARAFGAVADSLADAAESIEGRDIGSFIDEATVFARRNPLAFLAGAAVAGFAVSRFARATSEPQPEPYYEGRTRTAYEPVQGAQPARSPQEPHVEVRTY